MKYYSFKPENDRQCEVKLFADKQIYNQVEQTALQQLFNAAKLPGILGVVGMPDIHQGYGLPIGGVIASDINQGIISPGAVGFDINCGVRLLSSNKFSSEIEGKLKNLINIIKKQTPAGLGSGAAIKLKMGQFKSVLENGLPYLINELNFGKEKDINNCEEKGYIAEANPARVSSQALKRGQKQLGSLGSGNHFIEIQEVVKTYNNKEKTQKQLTNKYKLAKELSEGQLVFMIHTGSRGFGHQVAQDYINKAKDNNHKYDFNLPTKNLASFPINSREGGEYYKAMGAAANFAFANRQILTHNLRKSIKSIIPDIELELVYDLCHNIAKKEKHQIKDKKKNKKEVLIHRKGATRLSPGNIAIIPGSMGSGSYLVQSASSQATELSYQSVAHGAGRIMGRREAKRTINPSEHNNQINGIKVVSSSGDNLLDESPLAYKNIDTVINSLSKIGLAYPLAKMKPLAVLKG